MKAGSRSSQSGQATEQPEQPSSRASVQPERAGSRASVQPSSPAGAAGAETTGSCVPDIKRLGMLLVRDEQQPAARLQCLESNCPIAMIDKVAHNRKLGKRLAQTALLGEKTLGEINTW